MGSGGVHNKVDEWVISSWLAFGLVGGVGLYCCNGLLVALSSPLSILDVPAFVAAVCDRPVCCLLRCLFLLALTPHKQGATLPHSPDRTETVSKGKRKLEELLSLVTPGAWVVCKWNTNLPSPAQRKGKRVWDPGDTEGAWDQKGRKRSGLKVLTSNDISMSFEGDGASWRAELRAIP